MVGNPNDPFESVYSDPAQRRRTQQQRTRPVQAPPSTRGQQIFTEF